MLSRIEIYLVAVPAIAWFAVVLELARPTDADRGRAREMTLTAVVAAAVLLGAIVAGSVNGPLRLGHWLMFAVISVSTLGAMVAAVQTRAAGAGGRVVAVATLSLRPRNAILIIPLRAGAELVWPWRQPALTCCCLVWRWRFGTPSTRGQVLRAAMLRSFIGSLRWRCCSADNC